MVFQDEGLGGGVPESFLTPHAYLACGSSGLFIYAHGECEFKKRVKESS